MPRNARWPLVLLALAVSTAARAQAPDTSPTHPVLEHEAPLLAALEQTPAAEAIPLRARALHFPDTSGDSLVLLSADLPSGAPSVRPVEGDGGGYTQDFTVLALVRDAAGRIVYKSSRRYALTWTESDLEALGARRTLFESETILHPGQYSVEIAARDAQEGALGVIRLPLDLPPAEDEKLRLSSLMIVGRAEPRPQGGPGPRFYDGVQLHPNLGDPVSLNAGKSLTFLFTLRPGGRALASATVEVLRDGSGVVQSPVALPAPDPSGQMRVVNALEIGMLETGEYTLRLSVASAQGVQNRSTPFTLAP